MKTVRPHLLNAGLAVCALLCVLFAGAAEARARRSAHAGPVVVELYTAQGCSTCPQANPVMTDLLGEKGVLPLTFSVDYWNYLGWADTLAKPEFTARQKAYAGRLKVREISTPQMVIQGQAEAEGLDLERSKIDALIADARDGGPKGPRVRFLKHGAKVLVAAGPARGRNEVWLVRYDPEPVTVKITAGENRGKTVVIRNAVRQLVRLGVWRGHEARYTAPEPVDQGLKTLVIVQEAKGGPIIAAVRG